MRDHYPVVSGGKDGRAGIDAELVGRLVAEQFPQWADLPVMPVEFEGWDNRTYRLGETMAVRLPTAPGYAPAVAKESGWLPRLAPHLPVAVPTVLGVGNPDEDYPFPWSVRTWIDGEAADRGHIRDRSGFAVAVHGDVSGGNLLVADGALAAVIDFGTSGVGDPACDLVIAWTMFTGQSREAFRQTVAQDDGMWARARGWALWKALLGLANSNGRNPHDASNHRIIADLIDEHARKA